MCFGTFDLLHEGHRFYLNEAKKHGDRLIVVVSRDATVQQVKGKLPHDHEQQRLIHIAAVPMVDVAVLGNPGDKLAVVHEYHPDVLCLGYDQVAFTDKLAEQLAVHGLTPKIIRLSAYHPEKYKSSRIAKNNPNRR